MELKSAKSDYEFALWARFKSGDKQAFSEIYTTYADLLYNYGFHISSRVDLIEDAIQDLFIVLWQSKENLSNTTSIKYYLFRSFRRNIVKLLKKEELLVTHQDVSLLANAQHTLSAEMQIIEDEYEETQTRELNRALSSLTPRQLEAIRLHYYEGFELDRVASIMDMNEQSVRNILHRAFHKLRQIMLFLLLLHLFLQK